MKNIEKNIRGWIIFFMIVLFLSGLTAIPIEAELDFLSRIFALQSFMGDWLDKVYTAFHETNKNYPFLAYGYDWLAFAHFVLAVLFIGPLKNPVRNKWVREFGMIACLLVIPVAFMPAIIAAFLFWCRLIDCSFDIIGLLPLSICLKKINQLEKLNSNN